EALDADPGAEEDHQPERYADKHLKGLLEFVQACLLCERASGCYRRRDPPRMPPSTPRRIWRPIPLLMVRAACFAMVSARPWRRFVPHRKSLNAPPPEGWEA